MNACFKKRVAKQFASEIYIKKQRFVPMYLQFAEELEFDHFDIISFTGKYFFKMKLMPVSRQFLWILLRQVLRTM